MEIISAISSGAGGIAVTGITLAVKWIKRKMLKGKYDTLKLGGVEKMLEEEKEREREELKRKLDELVRKFGEL